MKKIYTILLLSLFTPFTIANDEILLSSNIANFERSVECEKLSINGEEKSDGLIRLYEEGDQVIAKLSYFETRSLMLEGHQISGTAHETIHLSRESIIIDNAPLQEFATTEGEVDLDELFASFGNFRSESVLKLKRNLMHFQINMAKKRSNGPSHETRSYFCAGMLGRY